MRSYFTAIHTVMKINFKPEFKDVEIRTISHKGVKYPFLLDQIFKPLPKRLLIQNSQKLVHFSSNFES